MTTLSRGGWLAAAPLLTLALLVGPVLAGLLGSVAPAFGYLPVLGGETLSLAPWRQLFGWPGLGAAVRLSVITGLGATLISLIIALLIVGALQGTRAFGVLLQLLSPLLSVPHAAAALGLAFVIAPSGWIARALSPWATGWQQPPDLLITQDPMGLALMAGLVIKEVPFLLLMILGALLQAGDAPGRMVAQTLGYGRAVGWAKAVLPRVYPQIRLPVCAVLAYSMTVVDVALILGPTRPATLSVQILAWMQDPALAMRFVAAAGAVLQVGLVLGALAVWRSVEVGVSRAGRLWIQAGARGIGADVILIPLATVLGGVTAGAVLLGLCAMAVWSVAGLWSFPHLLPESWSWRIWQSQSAALYAAAAQTLLLGAAATALALSLVIACLEAEHRYGLQATRRALVLLYLPLIVPQVAFLPGLQALALMSGGTGGRGAVIAAHVIFVLPYVYLSLGAPWRAWDTRAATVAASLGAGPGRVLWAVRLPMLLRPVLTAAAVGFAVSVGLYLPTLLIGAGRVATLTTEAVALSSGGNRRVIGAYALLQMALPFAAFALALALPAFAFRNRRGLWVAA